MLRKLKIQAELKKRSAAIAELKAKQADFEKRKADLESALAEAETQEDIELVAKQVEELESEEKEENLEEKVNAEQSEIDKLNAEMAEIDKAAPAAKSEPTATPEPQPTERSAKLTMINKRTIFGALSVEERKAIMADETVKRFANDIRETAKRGVNGANVLIPDVILGIIKPNLGKYSKIIDYVSTRSIKGEGRIKIAGTAPEAVWTDQYAAINEVEIGFNAIEFSGYKVGSFISVPNPLLEDSDENLVAEITEMLARARGKAIDRAILYGTGIRMPLGVATRLAQESQPADWGADAPTWTDLHTSNLLKLDSTESAYTGAQFFAALYAKLGTAYSDYATGALVWFMNRKTKAKIVEKSIAMSAAATVVSGINNQMPVIGGDIVEVDFIPDNDIIGGYFDLYKMVERAAGKLAISTEYKFVQDETVFKDTARYDGKPVFGEAFVIVNINNTNPTTTSTFAGDKANKELVSLSKLEINATPVTLIPPFDPNVLNYSCTVTAHSNKITVETVKSGATAVIKNGNTTVTNKGNATFTAGENTLTVTVTNGNAEERKYTVVVMDETSTG